MLFVQVLYTDAWLQPSHAPHTPPVIDDNELPIPGNKSFVNSHHKVLLWKVSASFLGNKVSYHLHIWTYRHQSVHTGMTSLISCLIVAAVLWRLPELFSVLWHPIGQWRPISLCPLRCHHWGQFHIKNYNYNYKNCNTQTDLLGSLFSHFQGNGQILRLSQLRPLFLSPLAEPLVSVAVVPREFVDNQTGVAVTHDDMLSVLADVTSLRVRVHLNAPAKGPIRWGKVIKSIIRGEISSLSNTERCWTVSTHSVNLTWQSWPCVTGPVVSSCLNLITVSVLQTHFSISGCCWLCINIRGSGSFCGDMRMSMGL